MSKKLLNLLLIVATFAVYYLLIGPVYKGVGGVWQPGESVKSLQVLNAQYDETLMQADALFSQAETLRSQYSRISDAQKDMMKVMVPDSIDKVRLLSEVSGILLNSGFPSNDLAFSDGPSSSNSKGTAAVSFTVKATYPKFKELMDTFEKSMRLFSIQDVSFSVAGKEGELPSYQVKLETYFIK
jgi:hypothetical protein